MLKNQAIKRIYKTSIALLILILLCIFPKNESTYPEEVIYYEESTIPAYVLDKNGYVARTDVTFNDNDEIKYIVDLLTINSLSSLNLPNNFVALIPQDTKLLSYDLKDGLLKLNFSKEFLNFNKNMAEKMLESLIFSLCELKNVNKIMIFVEDELLTHVPNSAKKLPSTLDKSYGINKVYNINDIKNTNQATIYYLSKNDNNLYYIPITKVYNEQVEAVEVIVKELKRLPIYETNLISYLNASYELKDYQVLENAISLSFNNQLLANLDDQEINEKVKYTLSLSLRDTYNIDDITIAID